MDLTPCTAGSLTLLPDKQASTGSAGWIPVVFLKSGAVSQPSWQLCRCVSKRQHLLHALIVPAAPSEIQGHRIPCANMYQACCSPGREADARSPQGGLCIQPWAFVLVSQVFPLNEAQGRGKSQPDISPVVNVMPSKNSHFYSALADLGLGFISTPLNYKRKTPIPKSFASQPELPFLPPAFLLLKHSRER